MHGQRAAILKVGILRSFRSTQCLTCLLAYLKNPTNPDSAADSSATSSVGPLQISTTTPGISGNDPSLAPAPLLSQASLGVQPPASQVNGLPSNFMEPNYEVFD